MSAYAILAVGLAFLVLSPGPSFERDGSYVDFVEQQVGLDVETVHARLAKSLDTTLQTHSEFAGSKVHRFEDNAFLGRGQMTPRTDGNVALERYARLEDSAWARDFYVTGPFGDWFSEYMQDGERLPFNTNFFIHLEPTGENETRIEVIEYFPRVHVGQDFRLCTRHGGPMVVRDIQPVAPTTRDRRMMLDLVVRVAERETPKLEQIKPSP
jgi:hypothetical protein